MRNGTLGMDFDSYARITILLNDHETIKKCRNKKFKKCLQVKNGMVNMTAIKNVNLLNLTINGTTFWKALCLFHLATLICQESAKLRALHTLAPMRLIHHWYLSTGLRVCAPYPSLICVSRACAFTCICPHQNVVLLQLKSKVCFMCAFQLTIHHISVSSVLFYHIKLFCMFFYFFCFES